MKLAELAGAAIAFVAIKRLTDAKPTVVTPTKPLITQGFVTGPAATGQDFSILPKTLEPTQVGPSIDPLIPTGPIKQPSADIPFFPETAVTAGQEFIAKDPFAGLAGLKDLPFNLPLNPPRK